MAVTMVEKKVVKMVMMMAKMLDLLAKRLVKMLDDVFY